MILANSLSHEECDLEGPWNDPVDHERTTRQHAGESLKGGGNAPGLVAIAIGVVALIVGLFALATKHLDVGVVAVILAAVAAAGGVSWMMVSHSRVRNAELHWAATHSDDPAPPPSS